MQLEPRADVRGFTQYAIARSPSLRAAVGNVRSPPIADIRGLGKVHHHSPSRARGFCGDRVELMRRFGIGLALCTLATSVQASDWRKVGESATVADLLVDMDSIERTGDTVSAWLKWPSHHSDYELRLAGR